VTIHHLDAATTALALLVVRRDVVAKTLIEDADAAASMAGLRDADELAVCCEHILATSRFAGAIRARRSNYRTTLHALSVSDAAVKAHQDAATFGGPHRGRR
jgi:hypothetical protein